MFVVTTKPPLNFNLGLHSNSTHTHLRLSVPSYNSSNNNNSNYSSDNMDLIPKLGKLFFVSQQQNKTVEVIGSDNNVVKDGFDAVSAETKVQPDHLVIMVNGIIGM